MKVTIIQIPAALANLYAYSDAERFPAAQLGEGFERPNTLYYADFSVAVPFGMKAVEDTFRRCDYKHVGYKMLTELVCVLNHLGWEYYELSRQAQAAGDKAKFEQHDKLARYFFDRYNAVNGWAAKTLKGDEARHYYCVLD